jgi:hypothetical protein
LQVPSLRQLGRLSRSAELRDGGYELSAFGCSQV